MIARSPPTAVAGMHWGAWTSCPGQSGLAQPAVETAVSSGVDTAYELTPGGAKKAVSVKPTAPTAQNPALDSAR